MKTMTAALLCLAFGAAAAPRAEAQMTWTDNAFVNVTGGAQTGSHTLATSTPFDLYDEKGTVSSSQKVGGGGFFDVSAGYKVWRNLAVGLGFSRSGSKASAIVKASVPDPLVYDRPRSVEASASGLKHAENAVHLAGTWMIPVTDTIDVGLSAGPSIFSVKQDLPGGVTVTEPGAAVSTVAVTEVKKTTVGMNLGVDVTYLLTKRIGVGGLARYTWGSADLQGASDGLTVGGLQIGVGGRFRF